MKTTIPFHVDTADLARLKEHIPDLSELELPKLQTVGRTADETIDRLLGRSRTPVWQFVVTGIGLVAVVGAIAAAFLWMRRPLMDVAVEAPSSESATTGYGTPGYGELDSTVGVEAV